MKELYAAAPKHRRVVVILANHIIIDDVEITEPGYEVPQEIDYWLRRSEDDKRVKAWNAHQARMVAARHNISRKSKMDLSKYHRINQGIFGEEELPNEECAMCDSNYFWEEFLTELKRVAGVPDGGSWPWHHECDPWSDQDDAQLFILKSASSYGDREERRITMSDIEALKPEITQMQRALEAFGLEPEFSFRTIWYE